MFSSYITKLEHFSAPRFILEVTALAFLSRFFLVLPVTIILDSLGVNLGSPNLESFNVHAYLLPVAISIILIGPFFETLVFQLLPLQVLKLLRVPEKISIIITTLVFAFAHLHEGLINFIGMLPIGFLFVWAFVVWRKKSIFKAIGVVFAIHALTNLIALVLYLMIG